MRHAQFLFVSLMIMAPTTGWCGPAEEANAVVDRWSAAYSGNDPETIASNYCPDAILLGTVSPVISVGTQAIIKYFTPSNGSGNKNTIDERHTIPIDRAGNWLLHMRGSSRCRVTRCIARVRKWPVATKIHVHLYVGN